MKTVNARMRHRLGVRQQQGVTLIEVMVSVLILGIALLGIAAMQATALRNGQSSLERSQVVAYSYSAIEAMRANRQEALAGAYNTDGLKCSVTSGGTLAQNDVRNWLQSLKNGMAGSPDDDESICGQIACVGGVCTVTVQWDDTRGSKGNGGENAANTEGGAQRQVQTVARI